MLLRAKDELVIAMMAAAMGYKLNAEKLTTPSCFPQFLLPQQAKSRLLLSPCAGRLQQSQVAPSPLSFRSVPTPSILPAYNHDQQFFTPAFLLPADKVLLAPSSPTMNQTQTWSDISSHRRWRPRTHLLLVSARLPW